MGQEIVWLGLNKRLDTGDRTANDQGCSSQYSILELEEREGAHRECHSGPHRSAPQTGWPHGGQYDTRHWSHCRPESLAVYIAVSIHLKKARAGQTYTLALVKARSQFCLLTIEIISGVFFFSSFSLATCVAASVPYAASVVASANFF